MTEGFQRRDVRNAILHFCFPDRVEDVNNFERYFMSQELAEFGYPNLGATSNRGEPMSCLPAELDGIRNALDAAWRAALLDLCTRIERGELVITGVQVLPDLQENRERIPGQWAKSFEVDPLRSVVVINDRRYVNVWIEPANTAESATFAIAPTTSRHLDPGKISDLNDETVLALLEEHAKRVIAGPDAKLIAPGKISLLPLVAGKMRYRAAHGDMLDAISKEAEWLAGWIKSKVELHHAPSAGTISKSLGREYAVLNTRSKADIQKSNI